MKALAAEAREYADDLIDDVPVLAKRIRVWADALESLADREALAAQVREWAKRNSIHDALPGSDGEHTDDYCTGCELHAILDGRDYDQGAE